jgi:hypothetical protein
MGSGIRDLLVYNKVPQPTVLELTPSPQQSILKQPESTSFPLASESYNRMPTK